MPICRRGSESCLIRGKEITMWKVAFFHPTLSDASLEPRYGFDQVACAFADPRWAVKHDLGAHVQERLKLAYLAFTGAPNEKPKSCIRLCVDDEVQEAMAYGDSVVEAAYA